MRNEALKWWRLFPIHEQVNITLAWKKITKDHRKFWPFGMIANSSSTIERIWRELNNGEEFKD
jgi:hypothetical protein